jgi:aryl-alcohol dehydrogenase-like predicted oxidoreductase
LIAAAVYPYVDRKLATDDGPLVKLAERYGGSPPQLGFAWLLQRSDVIMGIPGTSTSRRTSARRKSSCRPTRIQWLNDIMSS